MLIEPTSPVSPALAGKFSTTSATWEALSSTYICSISLSCNYSVLGLPPPPTAIKQVRCNICLSPQASPCPAHLPETISLFLSLSTPNTPQGPLSLSHTDTHTQPTFQSLSIFGSLSRSGNIFLVTSTVVGTKQSDMIVR